MPTPSAVEFVVVVVGASRGLGLEHVKQFLDTKANNVVATVRSLATAGDRLQELASTSEGRLHLVQLDTASEDSIKAAAGEIAKLHPAGIDLLLNNAGIQLDQHLQTFEETGEAFLKTLSVNVVGPFLTTKHLLPLLRKKDTRRIISISSLAGSMSFAKKFQTGQNVFGNRFVAYHASKAALNMEVVVLANALADEKFTIVALSPGFVDTDMANATIRALGLDIKPYYSPEESVKLQQKVIAGLTLADTGKFLDEIGAVLDD